MQIMGEGQIKDESNCSSLLLSISWRALKLVKVAVRGSVVLIAVVVVVAAAAAAAAAAALCKQNMYGAEVVLEVLRVTSWHIKEQTQALFHWRARPPNLSVLPSVIHSDQSRQLHCPARPDEPAIGSGPLKGFLSPNPISAALITHNGAVLEDILTVCSKISAAAVAAAEP